MSGLWREFRLGLRSLARHRWFTLGAAAIVMLAVGVNAVVMSALNTAFLRPLPYPQADKIVAMWETDRDGRRMQVAFPNAVDWQRESHSLDALAVFGQGEITLGGGEGDPEYVGVAAVGQQFLRVLGLAPLAGRWIAPEEAQVGGAKVAVISEGLWRRRFGGRPEVIGTSVPIGALPMTVVGVLPYSAGYPRGVDVWISAEQSATESSRTAHNWQAVARLKPNVTVAAAEAEISALTGRLMAGFSSNDRYAARGASLEPLRTSMLGSSARVLWLLQGAVFLILGIATVNLTNLMLVRATRLRTEVAICSALGADRRHLVRRFLLEAMTLTAGAGLAGVALAFPLRSVLHSILSRFLPALPPPALDYRVVAVSLLAALAVGAIAAVIPALRASREDPSQVLGGAGSPRVITHHPLMRMLISCQVALALMLLVGAGLLVRSLGRLAQVAPGFVSEGKVLARVPGAFPGLEVTPEAQVAAIDRLLEGARSAPGISQAAVTNAVPLRDVLSNAMVEVLGRDQGPGATQIVSDFRVVGPTYFQTMGVPLVSGRDFAVSDQLTTPRVAIVNQAFVTRYLDGRSPLGLELRFNGMEAGIEPWATVIAVAGDVRHRGLELPPSPEVYFSYRQRPFGWHDFEIVAGAKSDEIQALADLRAVLKEQYPSVPFRGETLAEVTESVVAVPRLRTAMLSLFAALAIGLAATGILSVVAFVVAERTREIGVRMALGAGRSQVTRSTMRWAMRPIWAGLALGAAGAWVGARLVQSFLFDTGRQDPLVFAAAVAGMAAIGAAASYLPARRASNVDPTTALRAD